MLWASQTTGADGAAADDGAAGQEDGAGDALEAEVLQEVVLPGGVGRPDAEVADDGMTIDL